MADPSRSLTPKQIARAIDVSESSIKRWCDKGVIATHHTAGGHRRIHLNDFVAFLRSSQQTLIDPVAVGLPVLANPACRDIDSAFEEATTALLDGSETACWQIVANLYLAGRSAAQICDEVLAPALREIGDRWECGSAEVFQERRACGVCAHTLYLLRGIVQRPQAKAPVAVGGTASGDPYCVPTQMVEVVLREAGYNALNLGVNLPFSTLPGAIEKHQPTLFWLSASSIPDEAAFLHEYQALYNRFSAGVAFVVGGRALSKSLREKMQFTAHCDNLQHLVGVAEKLKR